MALSIESTAENVARENAYRRYAAVLSAATAAVVVAVLAFPVLDLKIARLFYLGDGHFIGVASGPVVVLRNVFIALYAIACGVSIAALVMTRNVPKTFVQLGFVQWLFVAMCLAIGPGVVANLALKDQSGRARPSQIVEFGGSKQFTPALVPSAQCQRNCSFVSGESSSMFALFFAGACVWRRRVAQWIAAGLAAGGLAGLVRISQGGHFVSDVVFSGLFMAMTVLALHWLFGFSGKQAGLGGTTPALS